MKYPLSCISAEHQRKINIIIKSGMGEGEKYNPIWPYYEPHEVFLEDISDSSSTCDYETEAETDLDHPVITSYTSEAGTTYSSNSRVTAPPAQKRRSKNLPELSEAKEMANALSILNRVVDDVNARHDDDCELYAKLLATKLRKFPAYEREVIMLEIDSMLMKRRLGSQSTRSNWSGSSSPYYRPNSGNSGPPTYVAIPNQSPHHLPNSPQYVLNEPQHQRILSDEEIYSPSQLTQFSSAQLQIPSSDVPVRIHIPESFRRIPPGGRYHQTRPLGTQNIIYRTYNNN